MPQGWLRALARLPLGQLWVRSRATFAHIKEVWLSMEKPWPGRSCISIFTSWHTPSLAGASLAHPKYTQTQISPLQLLHVSEGEAADEKPVQQTKKRNVNSCNTWKGLDWVSTFCSRRSLLHTKFGMMIKVARCTGQFWVTGSLCNVYGRSQGKC